ncbi:MAG: carbohydrate binding family 9 domain-containing protein, partial [Bacteroidales bacterium]|nr:carbohydrate binding family 9 domain-containing protein [Bacteroidales bacterium]
MIFNKRGAQLIIVLIVIAAPFRLSGQAASPPSDLKTAVVIGKLAAPVNFDGIPGEEAWEALTPLPYIMHSPVFGKEPSEKTVTRIGYDDKYLYISSLMFYQDPSMIQSASLKRDYMGMGGDWFGVVLDTYNDKENGLAFFTSPDGLRWDATILKDAVVPLSDQIPFNISWNTFWDVKTVRDTSGWSLEMRIPFSSLRFQKINGEVRMGLILHRWIPSKNETDLFPAIPPNWGETSAMKPSQAQEVVIRDAEPDSPVYIAPYLLGGLQSS